MKANRLYWLGRYEERVYLTLHLLRKCYDKMIDGEPEDYETFWQKLDVCNTYKTEEDFQWGMMYDEENVNSVISAQLRAQDNAILLREDIMSETLSYIEMSIALMRRLKAEHSENITKLQSVTDWALAFWGSVQQRVYNNKTLALMYLGREMETLDFLLRYNYPFERVLNTFELMSRYLEDYPEFCDNKVMADIESMLMAKRSGVEMKNFESNLLYCLRQLVTV